MAEEEARRLLAVIRIASNVRRDELAARAKALQDLLSRFANGDIQLAFNSEDGFLFGVLFKTSVADAIIRAEIDKATTNADWFLICGAGDLVGQKGLGAAATWLQHR